jgi:hypothetical protein
MSLGNDMRRKGDLREPLDIIASCRSFERPEGEVGRQCNADNVGEEASSDIEEDQNRHDSGGAKDGVGLGHLSLALQVDQSGVL